MGSTLLLPFLPSISIEALAASGSSSAAFNRKRAIVFWNDAGVTAQHYFPTVTPTKVIGANVRETSLTGITGNMSYVHDKAWDAFRSRMIITRGLDMYTKQESGHMNTPALCASYTNGQDPTAPYPSMDQIIAQSKNFYSTEPRTRYLNHRAGNDGSISWQIVNGVLQRQAVVKYANVTFDAMFGTQTAATSTTKSTNERKQRLVDRLYDELKALKASTKLTATEKQSVDEHVTFVDEVQSRLMASQNLVNSCSATFARPKVSFSAADREQFLNDHINVLAAAIRCGYTKVATMMFMDRGGITDFSSSAPGVTNSNFHSLTHADNVPDKMQAVNTVKYLGSKVADFLTKINVVEDTSTGETYLDNSLVMWTCNHGAGVDYSFPHVYDNLAITTIGSAGGYFRTNRFLDYQNAGLYQPGTLASRGQNGVYNQFLIGIMDAMGVLPAERQIRGNAGFGYYGGASAYKLSDAERAVALPYFKG